MRGHVDTESLALCAEGLLSRRRSERIRAHVASCPECAAAQARLSSVPALLAQVPPPALPPGIAARMDAALSAEAARRPGPAPGSADGTPDHAASPSLSPGPGPRLPRRHGFPVAARVLAAAGVLVVAGGVGYAVARSSSPGSAAPGGSNAPAAKPAGSAVSRPDLRGPAIGTATFTVTHSGTSYRPGTFAHQAAGVMAHSSTGLIRPGSQPGQSRHSGPALTGCVTSVVGASRTGEVKLVDQARYQGRPATVIVVAASSAQPAEVYVARCSLSHGDVLASAPLR